MTKEYLCAAYSWPCRFKIYHEEESPDITEHRAS
jgi:hypothetical protein